MLGHHQFAPRPRLVPPLWLWWCLQGLENFEGILKESDGIILGRGDLGIDLAPEKVSLSAPACEPLCGAVGHRPLC